MKKRLKRLAKVVKNNSDLFGLTFLVVVWSIVSFAITSALLLIKSINIIEFTYAVAFFPFLSLYPVVAAFILWKILYDLYTFATRKKLIQWLRCLADKIENEVGDV